MQLEDYFDFQRPDDIRLKGTRVGLFHSRHKPPGTEVPGS
jgi:hypothetical protein